MTEFATTAANDTDKGKPNASISSARNAGTASAKYGK